MRNFADNALALTGSLALHVLIAALLFLGVTLRKDPQPIANNIVEGVLIDARALEGEIEPIEIETAPPDEQLPEEPPPPEPEPDPEPEIDEQALELERQQREAEERAREEEAERQRELERQQAEEQARLEAEEQARQEAEDEARREAEEQARREAEEESRRQAEEEAKRRAEEERRRQEEERRAREEAEQRRREEAEARRRAEAEAQLQEMLEAEEARRRAVASGLEEQYKLKIKQKIQRYWRPPPVTGNVSCELRVRQLRTGDLATIERLDCGGNAPLERSLEAAVNQASPFPLPDDPSLFDAFLLFKFDTDE